MNNRLTTEPVDLELASRTFADEVQNLLDATLPGERRIISVTSGSTRFVVKAEKPVELYVGGKILAKMALNLYLDLDRTGQYLKTVRSDFRVLSTLDNNPLFRLEYEAGMRSTPISHWHVHAERGSLSHLLGRAHAVDKLRVKSPHDMSSLHFPLGGERFRPGLEDFIEFLIAECGVDRRDGWRDELAAGRESWRIRQLRSVVRDDPAECAGLLQKLGWEVTPPAQNLDRRSDTFTKW